MSDSSQSTVELPPNPLSDPHCWRDILSDLVLWAVVFLLLFAVVRFGQWVWLGGFESVKAQTIKLDFHDASQLTKGSPVHFMGLNVGFVSSVKPSAESVQVVLKTYPNTPQIPKDAVFTIEFNGLAGAKSLEILPITPALHHELDSQPYYWTLDAIHPSHGYWAEEPIRIRDLFKTQTIMARAMEVAYENIYISLGQVESEEQLQRNIQSIDQVLVNARVGMVDMTKDMARAQVDSRRNVLEITTTMNDVNATVVDIIPYTTSAYFNREVLPIFQKGRAFIERFESQTASFNQNHLQPTRQWLQKAQDTMVQTKQKTIKVHQAINSTNQALKRTQKSINNLHEALQRKSSAERLKELDEKTAQWAQRTERLANPKAKKSKKH